MKVICKSCGVNLKAPEQLAGKTAKCPKCGSPVHVPDAPPLRANNARIPPATERQKEYASELGIEFPPDIDRRAISKLIDAAVEKRDDERFERLMELGDRESEAWRQMREAVLKEIDEEDCRLSVARPQQMVDDLANRNLGAILVWFDIDNVDDLVAHAKGVNFTATFADIITASEVRSILTAVGLEASAASEALPNASSSK
ncbi:MAG: hypothetical protein WD971_00575 [Pirellulales bacterium]